MAGVRFFSVLFGRTIAESKKKHEEKQLKAQQLRDKLRDEKTHKLQKLLERVSGHTEPTGNTTALLSPVQPGHVESFCQHTAK